MTIRRATVTDVPAMGKIINDAAEFGLMLPKSMAALYENVREFHVDSAGLVDFLKRHKVFSEWIR